LFGEMATTRAVSVATAAVEAALIVAAWVPSLSCVVCVPMVIWFDAVAAPVGSGRDAADTGTVWSLAMLTAIELAVVFAPRLAGS
jgi:hypothetical protein